MEYILKNEQLTVTVSDLGAELRSIRSTDGTEYLWQGDERYWSGRSPVLFPFTGRVIGGKYEWEGCEHAMELHGFSRRRVFTAVREGENSIVFLSEDDESTLACWPRKFSFAVEYTLQSNAVQVRFTVINEDEKEMLFGLGGHPGFNVPLMPEGKYEDWRIRFASPCRPKRVLLENAFWTGEFEEYPLDEDGCIPLSTELFKNDGVFLTGHTPSLILEMPGSPRSVTLSAPDMPYVGLWKPYNDNAGFLCIEPWWSLPSKAGEKTVFEEQPALLRLGPGQVLRRSWEIAVY